jgi:hypothetical protein
VVHTGFLVECIGGVVFAYDYGQFAGRVNKNLVSADSED